MGNSADYSYLSREVFSLTTRIVDHDRPKRGVA
jgi:hypothetical protein